ncbi:MAG: TonB-dependent receptor, partial [Sphingomonas sp.]
YRGAIEFDAADDVLLFANVSTGFLSGSINPAGLITSQQTSTNYEAGVKSRFLDRRVQLNASAYHTEYSNLASTFQRPNSAGGVDTLSVTGGKIKATGFEAILDVIPVENLHLTLSGNYLHSRYGDFPQLVSGQTYGGLAGGASRTINLRGYKTPYSPTFTGTVIASYDVDLGDRGKLTPQVQMFYSGSYFAHGNLPFNIAGFQDHYTKTDLRLSWTNASEKYGIEIFAENIENEIVNSRTQSGGDGIEQVQWGMPANYGVRLRAKF